MDLWVTYGFVDNFAFVGKSLFYYSAFHPKYDEEVSFHVQVKVLNIMHVPNGSFMSVQLAIGWICGLHMDSWITLHSWVNPYSIIVLFIQNMMKRCHFTFK